MWPVCRRRLFNMRARPNVQPRFLAWSWPVTAMLLPLLLVSAVALYFARSTCRRWDSFASAGWCYFWLASKFLADFYFELLTILIKIICCCSYRSALSDHLVELKLMCVFVYLLSHVFDSCVEKKEETLGRHFKLPISKHGDRKSISKVLCRYMFLKETFPSKVLPLFASHPSLTLIVFETINILACISSINFHLFGSGRSFLVFISDFLVLQVYFLISRKKYELYGSSSLLYCLF